jgi:hypothetical protein
MSELYENIRKNMRGLKDLGVPELDRRRLATEANSCLGRWFSTGDLLDNAIGKAKEEGIAPADANDYIRGKIRYALNIPEASPFGI